MEQISINLTVEEVNLVLETLGQRPYVEVFQLINKVKAQAEAQVEASKMRSEGLAESESMGTKSM